MERALVMDSNDNVATAISDLKPGEVVSVLIGSGRVEISIFDHIPFGHKFAIKQINEGDVVLKYGASIGVSTSEIEIGRHVHIHNLRSLRGSIK
jgi:altronate dehydratase small subunit